MKRQINYLLLITTFGYLIITGCMNRKFNQVLFASKGFYLTLYDSSGHYLLYQDIGWWKSRLWSFGTYKINKDSIVLNSYHVYPFDSTQVIISEFYDSSMNDFQIFFDSTTEDFVQIFINGERIPSKMSAQLCFRPPIFANVIKDHSIYSQSMLSSESHIIYSLPEKTKKELRTISFKTLDLINPQSELDTNFSYCYTMKNPNSNSLIVSIKDSPPRHYFCIVNKSYPINKQGVIFSHEKLTEGEDILLVKRKKNETFSIFEGWH